MRKFIVAKDTKKRHHVTLATVHYELDRAQHYYRAITSCAPVSSAVVNWASEIGRELMRLKTKPDFFSSEGQHKMQASNEASKGLLKSFVMHLAPGKTSGFQVCASASPGCLEACLNMAGHGPIAPVQAGRIRRTLLLHNHPEIFGIMLYGMLHNLNRRKYQVAIRLNGTSDVVWERKARWIFDMFPSLTFYDYTKHHGRFRRKLPTNYHLTFSRSETNHEQAMDLLGRGVSVAMVFSKPIYQALVEHGSFYGSPVVDGAADDRRWLDPAGSVVALKELGPAKADTSGFVMRDSLQAVGGIL